MQDFLEDYVDSQYYNEELNAKVIGDAIFPIREVEDKYYLSANVAKYVLAGGTKTFKTSTKTDLEIARPLLQSMHKMHRAGVSNYGRYTTPPTI